MECPDCGAETSLVVGGAHFIQPISYACDDCGEVPETDLNWIEQGAGQLLRRGGR